MFSQKPSRTFPNVIVQEHKAAINGGKVSNRRWESLWLRLSIDVLICTFNPWQNCCIAQMIIKSAEFMTLVPPHRRSSALELKHQISSLKRVLLLFYFEGSYFYLFLHHTSCMVTSSLMFSLFLILQLLSGSDFLFVSFPLTSGSVLPVTSKMSKLRSECLSKVLQTVGLRELDLEQHTEHGCLYHFLCQIKN